MRGACLCDWANVALRERTLAIRGSLGVSSAIVSLMTGVFGGDESKDL